MLKDLKNNNILETKKSVSRILDYLHQIEILNAEEEELNKDAP